MNKRSAVWQFIADFVRGVLAEPGRVIHWLKSSASIRVVDDQENRLELSANSRRIVADRVSRTVLSGGRIVARFEAIQAIEIKYHQNGDGPEWWAVSLRLSPRGHISIGKTVDDTAASIAAAKLGTITGKKVVALA